jgi:hypothetical protein
MAINWVISERRLSLLHTSEDGTLSPLVEFEDEVDNFEDVAEIVSAHRKEILKICAQHHIDPSTISCL